MPDTLPDWKRPILESGGETPFVLFMVYGSFPAEIALSREKYRSEGIPPGLDLRRFSREKNPGVLDDFLEGFLWEEIEKEKSAWAGEIRDAKECIVLKGEPEEAGTLNYLRDSVGLVTYFLDHGGCAVWDPLMFRWWEPGPWKEELFLSGEPEPARHVVILTTEDKPSRAWFHSRGMRKFGRPDISLRNVPEQYHEGALDLCNRFIDMQAFGGTVPEGRVVEVPGLPPGMTCHHRGSLEDPDFTNVRIEITFPDA